MGFANKDKFLSGALLKTEEFELPDGEKVLLRQLSVEQITAFRKLHAEAASDDEKLISLMVDVFTLSARNEDGTQMFDAADRPMLLGALSPDLARDLGMKVLGMLKGSAEDVEEVVKNSASDQSTASASA